MSASILQLESFFVRRLDIKCRDLQRQDRDLLQRKHIEPPVSVRMDFEVFKHKEEAEFLIPMTIEAFAGSDGLSEFERITIELTGVFSFPEGTPEEEINKFVPVLCLANLYGTARGIIIQASGSFPCGPYILPLVNMNEMVRESVSAKALKREAVKKKIKALAESKTNKPAASKKKSASKNKSK